MAVTLEIKNIAPAVAAFSAIPDVVNSGVKIVGPASEYALVWEWGSSRITQPGPKTTWGTNPNGETVILTLTAPNGYIRVNQEAYKQYINEELGKLQLSRKPIKEWGKLITGAMHEAAIRAAILIGDSAPIDTGELRSSVEPVSHEDPILKRAVEDAFAFIGAL